jgi:hypothetical protein
MTYQQLIKNFNIKFSQQWVSQRPDSFMDRTRDRTGTREQSQTTM